jgi:NTP pyrophosphatase (non-canonical NTP hydrolase)
MALIVEAAELVEHFQWLSERQSEELDHDRRAAVAEELADILIYTLRLASQMEIDLGSAAWAKLEKNRRKYPVEKARGTARKYTEL